MDKTMNGLFLTSISAALYAVITPLLKKAGLNPFATIIVQTGFLWLSILPFFLFTTASKNLSFAGITLPLLALAGIINAIGYYLSIRSYSYLPIWQINLFFAAISPIAGSIAAYFLLHEPISAKMFVGLGIILVGLTVAFR